MAKQRQEISNIMNSLVGTLQRQGKRRRMPRMKPKLRPSELAKTGIKPMEKRRVLTNKEYKEKLISNVEQDEYQQDFQFDGGDDDIDDLHNLEDSNT